MAIAPPPTLSGAEAAPARQPAAPSRNNNFNLLRLLFASLVLLSHAPELADGNRHREILTRLFGTESFGGFAVDGFFLLSGCLIVQSWLSGPNFVDFLKKRVLRIYPGFVVASLISALIVGPLAADAAQYFVQFNLIHYLGSVFLLHIPAVPVAFAGQPYPSVNGSMWTIPYEFRCYLLVALLGVTGLLKRRWPWLILTVVALGLSLAPAFISQTHFRGEHFLQKIFVLDDPAKTVRLLTFFCVGGCFCLYRDRVRFRTSWVIAAALLLIGCMFRDKTAQLGLATLGAYLLFWFAQVQSPLLARFRALPDISYGVYLYGWPVEKLLLWYLPGISPWLVFALACVLCVPLGLGSWFGIERPFLRLKPKNGKTAAQGDRNAALSPAAP